MFLLLSKKPILSSRFSPTAYNLLLFLIIKVSPKLWYGFPCFLRTVSWEEAVNFKLVLETKHQRLVLETEDTTSFWSILFCWVLVTPNFFFPTLCLQLVLTKIWPFISGMQIFSRIHDILSFAYKTESMLIYRESTNRRTEVCNFSNVAWHQTGMYVFGDLGKRRRVRLA